MRPEQIKFLYALQVSTEVVALFEGRAEAAEVASNSR